MNITYLQHQQTGYFSKLNIDYINGAGALRPFYAFEPNDKGLSNAILERSTMPLNRAVLVGELQKQYEGLTDIPDVTNNIALLQADNTFTVCTAHQPNLMTGFLYFVYKILHAVVLARHLKSQHPHANFVPVFYMGSEDNDLDELGVFRFNNTKFRWDTEQTGAVGRMHTKDLQALLQTFTALIGPPGAAADNLKEIVLTAYSQQHTIAQATRYLIHHLLGQYGVVVLDADSAVLKRQFLPVLKQELLQPVADTLVQRASAKLNEQYSAQAFSRPINLFYLHNNIRERIEKNGNEWQVVRTDIKWTEAALIAELEQHPERFSPNVILRGLYQETILPNVAFIGGGSEVAYWLQLKEVFAHYHVFYPALILRQSSLFIDEKSYNLQHSLGLSNEQLFAPTEKIIRDFVVKNSQKDLQMNDALHQLNAVFEQIKVSATHVDITLKSSAEAALTKMKHQINVLEKKMMRAEKRNMSTKLAHIYKLKNQLFPNASLQERYDTFMPYYLSIGPHFFELILKATVPYGNQFAIVKY